VGPSLYISDPVTETHVWSSSSPTAGFLTAGNWTAPGVPNQLWAAELRNTAVASQQVTLSASATVNSLVVAGGTNTSVDLQLTGTQSLTTFG
jgi:hypothetical protein